MSTNTSSLSFDKDIDLLTSIILELGGVSRINWANVATNMKEEIKKDAARMRYNRWKPRDEETCMPSRETGRGCTEKDVDLLTSVIRELGGVKRISWENVAGNMREVVQKDAARMRYNRWRPKDE